MKIMIGLLFVVATVSGVASETANSKDIYGGKRDDDHGAKPIMAQLQFTNNVGHNSHYVIAPVGQSQLHKHPLSVSFGPSPHTSSHGEPAIPYPGVYSYQSRLGPIQYSLSQQHQPISHQPPIHMVLTYHPNSPPSHRNIINQIHHAPPPPPPPPSSLNHISLGGSQYHKFSQPPHNLIQPVGQHFLHIPQHHAFRHQSHQSPFVPIAVPLQYVQHRPSSGHTFSMFPSSHPAVSPTASAIATALPGTAAAQQDEQQQQQHSAIPTPQSTTTTILQPVQHYGGSNQQEIQHFTQPSSSQGYHQQQQPHYSYSIQPSIQVAATKQVVVPVASSSPQQYKQDSSLGSSQYSNEPAAPASQQQHHVYFPTHSTQVFSTSKPYIVTPIHPTGPGSTVDYTSAAGALQVYQQIGGKASAVSASKYA